MTYNFCTYFDKNYLIKGLALYRSLERNCDDFKLWILCLDDKTFEILNKLNLKKAELIKLPELEKADPGFFATKSTRNIVEYFWTSTPCLTLYVLKKNPSLQTITYLDADLYFFDSPKEIYRQFGNNSILIIPHHFAEKKRIQWEKISGVFNVGLLIFRNNQEGLKCLEWWRERCLEWCYNRVENGLYGDQKYLDHFPEKFKELFILPQKGSNLATWNIRNYKISQKNGKVFVDEDALIFFHFASFRVYPKSNYRFFSYGGPTGEFSYSKISIANHLIYKPYAKAVYDALKEAKNVSLDFNYGLAKRPTILKQTKDFTLNILRKILRKEP